MYAKTKVARPPTTPQEKERRRRFLTLRNILTPQRQGRGGGGPAPVGSVGPQIPGAAPRIVFPPGTGGVVVPEAAAVHRIASNQLPRQLQGSASTDSTSIKIVMLALNRVGAILHGLSQSSALPEVSFSGQERLFEEL